MNESLSNFIVNDRQSFIEFIDLLREDLVKNPETWENKNLGDFLEALATYTQDIQGYYDNTRQKINEINRHGKSLQIFLRVHLFMNSIY